MNYKDQPEELTKALLELELVKNAYREYDYWAIHLTDNQIIYLGEDLDTWEAGTNWNNKRSTLEGFTNTQDIKKVVSDFANWVKGLES